MVERPLRMREVPRSILGFSKLLFCVLSSCHDYKAKVVFVYSRIFYLSVRNRGRVHPKVYCTIRNNACKLPVSYDAILPRSDSATLPFIVSHSNLALSFVEMSQNSFEFGSLILDKNVEV